jgi:hypothetical protein
MPKRSAGMQFARYTISESAIEEASALSCTQSVGFFVGNDGWLGG